MTIHRAIWLIFFALGGAALVGVAGTIDGWATAAAFPGAETYCRGTLGGQVPVSRAPLCLAVWFSESKAWLGHASEMILHAGAGMYRAEVLRTADVGLFAVGGIALGLALNWLWATAMAHVTHAVFASSYTLLQGLSHILRGRPA